MPVPERVADFDPSFFIPLPVPTPAALPGLFSLFLPSPLSLPTFFCFVEFPGGRHSFPLVFLVCSSLCFDGRAPFSLSNDHGAF